MLKLLWFIEINAVKKQQLTSLIRKQNKTKQNKNPNQKRHEGAEFQMLSIFIWSADKRVNTCSQQFWSFLTLQPQVNTNLTKATESENEM